MKSAPIGTRVRLTKDFLRSTGQIAGGEGHSKWTVVECDVPEWKDAKTPCGLCRSGRFIAVDEPSTDEPQHRRHFNIKNMERCR